MKKTTAAKKPKPAAQKAGKHPGGRPTKYRPEMCKVILDIGAEGGCIAEMADACDITISTLYNWANDKDKPEFLDALTRAQVKAEAFHAKRIRDGMKAAPADFQGAANLKYMAVRFNERWSEKARIEHTGKDGGPIQTESLTDIEIARRIAFALSKAAKEES